MVAVLALTIALSQQPETLSLLGEPLYPLKLSKSDREASDEALRTAHDAYTKTPNDVEAILALARAHLPFGRLGDAIEILTHGLEANPANPLLLLERGRGYILMRKLDVAQRDLRKAADTEAAAHCALGLAHYLAGAYAQAHASYARCADPGVLGYLAARRAGQAPAQPAPAVRPGPVPDPIRLPGSAAPRTPAVHAPLMTEYQEAIEQLLDGKTDAATARLKEIVQKHRRDDWMDAAYIAAEADYARLYKPPHKKRKQA